MLGCTIRRSAGLLVRQKEHGARPDPYVFRLIMEYVLYTAATTLIIGIFLCSLLKSADKPIDEKHTIQDDRHSVRIFGEGRNHMSDRCWLHDEQQVKQ